MTRGKEVSPDLCWTVVRLRAYSVPKPLISLYTDLSERMLEEIQHRFRSTGDPANKVKVTCRGRRKKLKQNDLVFLRSSIERRPNIYLQELVHDLAGTCGVKVTGSCIWRSLRRMGMTRKQITKFVIERKQELRDEYMCKVAPYPPDYFVFVDESAIVLRTPDRAFGWSDSGERTVVHGNFVRGSRYSVLPALSLGGIIHLNVVEGSFDVERFLNFLRELLEVMEPYPAPRSVLVMDNCPIHKVAGVRELVESHGVRLIYLPPYSPDFNPIELAFSSIKSVLRGQEHELKAKMTGQQEDESDLLLALHRAVYTVTPEKANAWYRKCGYLV